MLLSIQKLYFPFHGLRSSHPYCVVLLLRAPISHPILERAFNRLVSTLYWPLNAGEFMHKQTDAVGFSAVFRRVGTAANPE